MKGAGNEKEMRTRIEGKRKIQRERERGGGGDRQKGERGRGDISTPKQIKVANLQA